MSDTDKVYEGMFLLDSGRFASNPDGLANEVVNILKKAGGEVLAHRPWQDLKLAYPIDGHKKGIYYLTYFRLNKAGGLAAIDRSCHLSDNVIRHLVLRVDSALVEPLLAMMSGESQVLSNFTGDPNATEIPTR